MSQFPALSSGALLDGGPRMCSRSLIAEVSLWPKSTVAMPSPWSTIRLVDGDDGELLAVEDVGCEDAAPLPCAIDELDVGEGDSEDDDAGTEAGRLLPGGALADVAVVRCSPGRRAATGFVEAVPQAAKSRPIPTTPAISEVRREPPSRAPRHISTPRVHRPAWCATSDAAVHRGAAASVRSLDGQMPWGLVLVKRRGVRYPILH